MLAYQYDVKKNQLFFVLHSSNQSAMKSDFPFFETEIKGPCTFIIEIGGSKTIKNSNLLMKSHQMNDWSWGCSRRDTLVLIFTKYIFPTIDLTN